MTPVSLSEEEQEPLPPGWEEKLDPESGKVFYIDHTTRTTTFCRPAPPRPPAPVVPPPYEAATNPAGGFIPLTSPAVAPLAPSYSAPHPQSLQPSASYATDPAAPTVGTVFPAARLAQPPPPRPAPPLVPGKAIYARILTYDGGVVFAAYKHVLDVVWAPETPHDAVVVVLKKHSPKHPEREVFKFIDMDGPNSNFEHGSRVTIMADNGRYWQADGGAGHYVSAKSSRPKTWEIFKLHRLDDGKVAFESHDGKFLQALVDPLAKLMPEVLATPGQIVSRGKDIDEWERFTLEEVLMPASFAKYNK